MCLLVKYYTIQTKKDIHALVETKTGTKTCQEIHIVPDLCNIFINIIKWVIHNKE